MFQNREFRFRLEDLINALYLHKMGRPVDLKNPRAYSDKVQWLKLYDQSIEQVLCCDKLLVRTFVSERIGQEYLLDLHHVSTRIDDPQFEEIKMPFMLKTNHDSGSVFYIYNKPDLTSALKTVSDRMLKPYGVLTGEWAYFQIKPLVFAETMLAKPVEYKFYCCDGTVKWVRSLIKRPTDLPKSFITDIAGLKMPLSMDNGKLYPDEQPERHEQWDQMIDIAQELSRGFRYVRVDLYCNEGRIYFGELTFWPTAGFASVKHDNDFGEMLDTDFTFKRTPILSEYRIAKNSRVFKEIRGSDLYPSLRDSVIPPIFRWI